MVPPQRLVERRASSTTRSRRELLASAGGGVAATLAGCTRFASQTLEDAEIERRDRTTIHNYRVDGERIAEVSLTDLSRAGADRWRYPIRANVWHGDGFHLERLAYTFRPERKDHPPEFYLKRPDGVPWKRIQFSRGEDPRTTVLEVPELGFQGRGSVAFELLVAVADDDPFDLRVDFDATLESDRRVGRSYRVEGSLERTLPGQRTLE